MSTGALSTSFQLPQGLGAGGGFGSGAGSIDSVSVSAVTTPAVTPLPSARGNEPVQMNTTSITSTAGGATGAGGGDDSKEREPTPFFTPLPGPSTTTNVSEDPNQTFSTPGNVFSPLSPSATPAGAEGALTTPGTSGSGGSKSKLLAAYPLNLSVKDMAGSGDLDGYEEDEDGRPSTTPIPTINEEEEEQVDARIDGGVDGGKSTTPLGLPRPDSGASWAPQAQLSRAFSNQTEDVGTLTYDSELPPEIDINVDGYDDGEIGGGCGEIGDGHMSNMNSFDNYDEDNSNLDDERPPITGIDASSSTSIPCALAVAAEEAGGFIQSLYRSGDGSRSGEYLLAVRCAGDFIGETALIGGSSVRRSCSVRASMSLTQPKTSSANEASSTRSNKNEFTDTASEINDHISTENTDNVVKVAVIPYSVAKEYLKAHPLAKQRLAEMVWSRQSETIVLEGLLRLAGISRELHDEARKQVEKSIENF
jgi:hypothetical protein